MDTYNLHFGGDRVGTRLNRKVGDGLNEEQILTKTGKPCLLTISSNRSKKRL
jgi:hypothetical protein